MSEYVSSNKIINYEYQLDLPQLSEVILMDDHDIRLFLERGFIIKTIA